MAISASYIQVFAKYSHCFSDANLNAPPGRPPRSAFSMLKTKMKGKNIKQAEEEQINVKKKLLEAEAFLGKIH